jgi:DNA polymerase III subunit delta
MTPGQFLARIEKQLPPAVLLLGPETYGRGRIRAAMSRMVPEDAVARFDLSESPLSDALDDARSLSLFASERLVWISNAEAALPRGRGAEESGEAAGAGDAASLAEYVASPTPGVTLVFDAARYDFEGDDKRGQERVRKFFASVREVVELRRYSYEDARADAGSLAKTARLRISSPALDLLVEALGSDMARIVVEIEKLALYAGDRQVSEDDVVSLAPDARASTIFALVNALGRRDRGRSLQILDVLVREGEYLPLALSFLSTQFRMALAARDAGLKNASQIQAHFSRMGTPMWGSRAEQIFHTAAAFRAAQLVSAVKSIAEADRGLRDARPDDRVIMERLILALTA